MTNTWTFNYYAWFGPCDISEDVEYEADVSEEEVAFLTRIGEFSDTDSEEYRTFLRENADLIDSLSNRVGLEIEEYEGIDCSVREEDDEEEHVYSPVEEEDGEFEDEEDEWAEEEPVTESEEDQPELRIRWPWE